MRGFIDITNQRFGQIVVLRSAGPIKGRMCWHCRCDCGRETIIRGTSLRSNVARSCGCLRKTYGHGHTRNGKWSPTYRSWKAMMSRCYNPNYVNYSSYGGKGVVVHEPWHVFANYLAEVGERLPGTTMDRYPNRSGNYVPGNVRWATPKQQRHNRDDYIAQHGD